MDHSSTSLFKFINVHGDVSWILAPEQFTFTPFNKFRNEHAQPHPLWSSPSSQDSRLYALRVDAYDGLLFRNDINEITGSIFTI